MPNNQIQLANSHFILYQDDNGITNVNVRFDGNDVWLAQQQIAMLFDTTQQNVSLHINSILNESELPKEATHKFFLLVRQEGNRSVKRQIEHYNLDMIIAIGYRVKSQVATRFRQPIAPCLKVQGVFRTSKPLKRQPKNLKRTDIKRCCSTKAISTEPLSDAKYLTCHFFLDCFAGSQ